MRLGTGGLSVALIDRRRYGNTRRERGGLLSSVCIRWTTEVDSPVVPGVTGFALMSPSGGEDIPHGSLNKKYNLLERIIVPGIQTSDSFKRPPFYPTERDSSHYQNSGTRAVIYCSIILKR